MVGAKKLVDEFVDKQIKDYADTMTQELKKIIPESP
jgi:hypothetical protein